MRVLSAYVSNFGSYEELKLDTSHKGLVLISGPTGAGKSTLCDIIPWVLYGVTSKQGSMDEVRRWGSRITSGQLRLEINGIHYLIDRKRGKSSDLYICEIGLPPQRGKDIPDTQRLINALIGLDVEQYLSSSYYHEFSRSAAFFTTTPKFRRQMTEQLVDLGLAKKVGLAANDYTTYVKKSITEMERELSGRQVYEGILRKKIITCEARLSEWDVKHKASMMAAEVKAQEFHGEREAFIESQTTKLEAEKQSIKRDITLLEARLIPMDRINSLEEKLGSMKHDSVCATCGNPKSNQEASDLKYEIHGLMTERGSLVRQIATLETRYTRLQQPVYSQVENPYTRMVEDLVKETNPHTLSLSELMIELNEVSEEIRSLEGRLKDSRIAASDVNLLSTLVSDFRSLQIRNSVLSIQTSMNDLLTNHFDAELKVRFDLEGLDKLDVSILKDGNESSYTQLSKGQRQLLKFTFGISVMKHVSNHNQTSTNTLWFDEALEGFDEVLKVKAFSVLSKLASTHESVFVVEHSPHLKELFTNKLNINLSNGVSRLET